MVSKNELLKKINSCGDCKETKIDGLPLMCDKHWEECKRLEEELRKNKIISKQALV